LNNNVLQFTFAGAAFFKDLHKKPCTLNEIIRCKSFITIFLVFFSSPYLGQIFPYLINFPGYKENQPIIIYL